MLFVLKNRQISERARSTAAAFTCLAALGAVACGPASPDNTGGTGGTPSFSGGGGGGVATSSGGAAPVAGTPGAGTPGAGGSVAQGGAAPIAGSGGAVVQGGSAGQAPTQGGSAGAVTLGGAGGKSAATGGSPGGGAGGASGGTGGGTAGANHTRDHCVDGYDPDPSDATMKDGPLEFVKSGQVDLTVQQGVLDWFRAHVWEEAHFQWHNIRRCSGGMVEKTKGGGIDPCKFTNLVPQNQEGKGDGDGLEFLAMHRHMIQSLKQLWPKHTEQFEGWDTFPTKASDVPQQWQANWSAWAANISTAAAKADNPAANMNEKGFENEGAFGQWIQTTSGLHGALHFKWVRPNNSDHGLGNQFANIDNYMFWKMHGWIDKVWDKYRAAKGKTPNDKDIKEAILAQCRQMDQLALLVKPDLDVPCTPAPAQTGVFVTSIRPIFESAANKCTGCHGPKGANANLTLGGSECVKSSDIVAALVNKPSVAGGQFKLVVPGDPDKSWLYIKSTGKAATAGCVKTGNVDCNIQNMPQGGGMLTQAEQDALRAWIMDGAKAPQ